MLGLYGLNYKIYELAHEIMDLSGLWEERSKSLYESSSTANIMCIRPRRLRRVCAFAQARLSLRWLPVQEVPKSHVLAHTFNLIIY